MHQQARHPPRGSSPAASPQTNPTRTNNPRDGLASRMRPASETAPPGPSIDLGAAASTSAAAAASTAATSTSTTATPTPTTASPSAVGAGPTRESIKKLDQIVQNFFLKAAVLIVQARIPVTPSGGSRGKKTNKWFQIETDDIDDFKEELRTWKNCGSFDPRRQPMVIETYLDASRLAPGQALAVLDENGKRWDALETLNTSSDLSASGSSGSGNGNGNGNGNNGPADTANKIRTRSTEIILERWKVELQSIPSLSSGGAATGGGTGTGPGPGTGTGGGGGAAISPGLPSALSASLGDDMEDFGPILPTIYKRSIVFFRSLFVTTRVLPTYRFSRQATTKGVHPALTVRCRVLTGADSDARISATGFDNLRQPLYFDGARDPITDYMFGDLEVPVGRLSTSVTYRNDCTFRIDDSESLLSSRFMGLDETYFKPSLPSAQRSDSFLFRQPQQHQQQHQPHQQFQQYQQQQQQQQQRRQHRQSTQPLPQQLHVMTSPYTRDAEVGSLPSRQHGRNLSEQSFQQQPQQTYGSMSTFHGAGALGTSPITALKAVRPIGSDTSSPTDSIRPSSLEHATSNEPPHSLPIAGRSHHHHRSSNTNLAMVMPSGNSAGNSAGTSAGTSARPLALRNLEGGTSLARRPSVSFQPFKAGSLSGSPRLSQEEFGSPAMPVPSSPLSGSRPTSGLVALAQARNRSSLTAGMAASLRGAPAVSTSVGSTYGGAALIDPGQSPSPRPGGSSRYNSSFTHRRARSSVGGASRADDDQGSSGKQSLSSSMAQPGSGLLAEIAVGSGGGGGGSSSFQTDEDNISEFLKTLDSKKTLQSFEQGGGAGTAAAGGGNISSSMSRRGGSGMGSGSTYSDAAARRTVAQLSRFQLMRESNSALTESMSLSMQMAAAAGGSTTGVASMSVSMSPKPLSPHTPHTPHMPAVPSRLSENAIIDYQQGQPAPASSSSSRRAEANRHVAPIVEHVALPPSTDDGVTAAAIDIPLSPRLLRQHQRHLSDTRRSSSAVQKARVGSGVHDDDDDAGHMAVFDTHQQRSLSVGAGRAAAGTGAGAAGNTTAAPPSLSSFFRLGGGDATVDTGSDMGSGGAAIASSTADARVNTAGTGATVASGAAAPSAPGNVPSSGRPGSAMAAALRTTTAAATVMGTSPRRRYVSQRPRKEAAAADSVDSSAGGVGCSTSIGASGSDHRPSPLPALSSSSRGSFSGSFLARYGGGSGGGGGNRRRSGSSGTPGGSGMPGGAGADGEADDEPLVFDLLELGREPNRRSLEEGRDSSGGGSNNASTAAGSHHPGWHS